jgi:hypothetical protein
LRALPKKKGPCHARWEPNMDPLLVMPFDRLMALPYIMHAPKIRFSLLQRKEGEFKKKMGDTS